MKRTCLIVALLSILFSGLLLADHKSSHNPGEKVPKTWVLLDANGGPVGEILSIDLDSVLVNLTIAEKPVFLWVSPSQILPNAQLFFESDDCTGAQFGRNVSSVFGFSLDLWHLRDDFGGIFAVRIIDTTRDLTSAVPYLRSGGKISKTVYQLVSDGECDLVGQVNVYPMVQLADDLNDLYPPPYTLVEK